MMTIAMVSAFIPTFFITPFAGVWADRHNRKTLMIIGDLSVAAITLALFFAFRFGFSSVWIVIAALALRALGQGIQSPSVSAFLPQICKPEWLMRVNSINSAAQSAMMLAAPAIGGVLYKFFPLEVIFIIDVITAIIAVTILKLFVKNEKQKYAAKGENGEKNAYFADMRLRLKYVFEHKYLRRVFYYLAPAILFIAPVAILFALIITKKFGGDETQLAINDTVFAIGMLAGSGLMMIWGGFKNKTKTIALGFALTGAATIGYALVPSFWWFLALTVLVGISMPLFNTPLHVLIQKKTDGEYLGRVMSLSTMLNSVGLPLGLVVFGPMADWIGIELVFIITGAAILAITIMFSLDPVTREFGRDDITGSE